MESARKLKRPMVVNTDVHSVPKKRKIMDFVPDENFKENVSTDLEIHVNTGRRSIKKIFSEEQKEDEKMKQLECLKKFMNIGTKYSQFLEKKMENSEPSTSDMDEWTAEGGRRQNVIENLNYFNGRLHDYQVEGVLWLKLLFENSLNGILADEMGLGKTIQIIAFFCHLYERRICGPFLIVVPLSTLTNWEREFHRFAPKLPVICLHGSKEQRREQIIAIEKRFFLDNHSVKPIVICSFETPLGESTFFHQHTWQYIVVDEGQRIKNPDSKLSILLRSLKSVNRTILTGTPLQNNLKELWSLFQFIMPTLFKDIDSFSYVLLLEDLKDRNKLLQNEAKNHVISTIHKILAPFMLRRKKTQVFTNFVPKKEVIIECSLSEMQKYLYLATLQYDLNKLLMGTLEMPRSKRNRTKTKFFDEFEDDEDTLSDSFSKTLFTKGDIPVDCPDTSYKINLTMQNIVVQLKKIVNHPYLVWAPLQSNKKYELLVTEDLVRHSGKFRVLDALLKELKKTNHKVLIFSTMVTIMGLVEEMLIMRGYEYRSFDGSSRLQTRDECIKDFKSQKNVFIFLLSTRAGGLGLNLVEADTVIFMDRDWNPMADLQAQDRCHRIGQTKPVMVYSLIMRGTVDEVILNRGDMKRRLEKFILTEDQFKPRNVNGKQLKDLEELLLREEERTIVHSNGLLYTPAALQKILDRSELMSEYLKGQGKEQY